MSEEGQPSEPIVEPEQPSMPFVTQSKEVKDVIDLRNLLDSKKSEGKIGIIEYLMISDFMDRREDRKRLLSQPQRQPLTKEDIIKITKEVVTPPTSEPSEEMKTLLAEITNIKEKLEKQDKEKENQQLIKEATEPFKAELEKEREKTTLLSDAFKKIEEKIEKPAAGTGVTDPVKYVSDLITSLKNTGIIPAEKEKGATISYTGPDGLPVKGEIPGPVVWIPWFINQLKVPITDIVDEVGKRWMAAGLTKPIPGTGGLPQPQPNTLIRLPDKPKFESPPPPKPEMPQVEQKPQLIKVPEPSVPVRSLSVQEVSQVQASPDQSITSIFLEKLKMPQLWKIAADFEISKKGKKAEIIQRILDKQKGKKNEQGKPSI